MTIGVLVADGFQDSEYFLPKFEIEKMGVQTEVISLTREPIELISSRNPDDMVHFPGAIREWLRNTTQVQRKRA